MPANTSEHMLILMDIGRETRGASPQAGAAGRAGEVSTSS